MKNVIKKMLYLFVVVMCISIFSGNNTYATSSSLELSGDGIEKHQNLSGSKYAQDFYEFLVKYLSKKKYKTVLDLYSGISTWGILVSKYVDKVISIEENSSATSDAFCFASLTVSLYSG